MAFHFIFTALSTFVLEVQIHCEFCKKDTITQKKQTIECKILKNSCLCFFSSPESINISVVLIILLLLVRAECVRCPWLQAETKVATIGPSGVRATAFST